MSYHQYSREDFLPDADPPIVRRYCLHVDPDDFGPLPARCHLAPGHRGHHAAKSAGLRAGSVAVLIEQIRWANVEPVVDGGSLFEEGAA